MVLSLTPAASCDKKWARPSARTEPAEEQAMLPTFTCVGHRNSTVSAIQMPARLQDHHRGAPSTASNHDQPRTRHSHTTVHTARRTGCDPQVGRGVTLTGLQGQAVLKGCEHRLVSTDRSVSMAVSPKKSEGFQHPELWTKTFTDTDHCLRQNQTELRKHGHTHDSKAERA